MIKRISAVGSLRSVPSLREGNSEKEIFPKQIEILSSFAEKLTRERLSDFPFLTLPNEDLLTLKEQEKITFTISDLSLIVGQIYRVSDSIVVTIDSIEQLSNTQKITIKKI